MPVVLNLRHVEAGHLWESCPHGCDFCSLETTLCIYHPKRLQKEDVIPELSSLTTGSYELTPKVK